MASRLRVWPSGCQVALSPALPIAELTALGVGDVGQEPPTADALLRLEAVVGADDVGDGIGEIPLAGQSAADDCVVDREGVFSRLLIGVGPKNPFGLVECSAALEAACD